MERVIPTAVPRVIPTAVPRVIPTAMPSSDWVGVLNVLDLKNLTLTATVNNTRNSGGKQIVLEALLSRFKDYEAIATALTNEALRELCKTRGIKGISTLSKQELVGQLLISNIHMFDGEERRGPVSGIVKSPLFGEIDFEKTEAEKPLFSKKVPKKRTRATPEDYASADCLPSFGAAELPVVKVKKNLDVKKPEKCDKKKDDAKVLEPEAKEEVKKVPIPKKVKTDIWNTFIGAQIPCHKCLCCLKATISNTDFHVGHVVSEFNGGNLNIDNLRPICASCNYSMGTTNLKDYVIKYGYFY